MDPQAECEGILLVDKPKGKSAFFLVSVLRRITKVKKIGHAGTLDPFATGVMVMLIGKNYTRLQPTFLNNDKEYQVKIRLGSATNTFDTEGKITQSSDLQPSPQEIKEVLSHFQGEILQKPPMFSAKKVEGKKLYELARKGIEIERESKKVTVSTSLLSYNYPYLELQIACSKGTYIRSIAHEIGLKLKCFAHAEELVRTKSGSFSLEKCLTFEKLTGEDFRIQNFLHKCKSSTPLMTSQVLVHQ